MITFATLSTKESLVDSMLFDCYNDDMNQVLLESVCCYRMGKLFDDCNQECYS